MGVGHFKLWATLSLVLVMLSISATAHATTITNVVALGGTPSTAVITPLQVDPAIFASSQAPNSVIVGPQSVLITFSNRFTPATSLAVFVTLTNARFAGIGSAVFYDLEPPATGGTGSLKNISSTGCVVTVANSELDLTGCTFSGTSGTNGIGALVISGITYDNAAALATPGQSIRMSVQISNGKNTSQLFEVAAPTTVAASTGSVGGGSGSTSTYTLQTATAGSGSGSVAASPTGPTYPAGGTVVTLTATTGTGSVFAGWSGACSGLVPTCQVTMDSNRSVTATFNTTTASGYTLTASYQGSGSGTITASPPGPTYATGAVVVLTASAASGSVFGGWLGACSGTASTCQVTMTSNKAVQAVFSSSTGPGTGTGGDSPPYTLQTVTSGGGSGTITRTPAGPNYGTGTVVTLTATATSGSTFTGWSGACSGSASTCQVTMNSNQSATASFNSGLRLGSVTSTAQSASQSFLRFYNSGSTVGTVSVVLGDPVSGAPVAQWTSPSIAPGTAPQFSIGQIESAAASGFAKPSYYSVTITPQFAGSLQHVLWHLIDGTITNLSTCDTGVTAVQKRLVNVHSSLIGNAGYPSAVVVFNAGAAAASVPLDIYNAGSGTLLGTYTTPVIQPNGQIRISVAQMETVANISPSIAAISHFVVAAPAQFTGFLQHLVTNERAGVTTDLTTVCALSAQ